MPHRKTARKIKEKASSAKEAVTSPGETVKRGAKKAGSAAHSKAEDAIEARKERKRAKQRRQAELDRIKEEARQEARQRAREEFRQEQRQQFRQQFKQQELDALRSTREREERPGVRSRVASGLENAFAAQQAEAEVASPFGAQDPDISAGFENQLAGFGMGMAPAEARDGRGQTPAADGGVNPDALGSVFGQPSQGAVDPFNQSTADERDAFGDAAAMFPALGGATDPAQGMDAFFGFGGGKR